MTSVPANLRPANREELVRLVVEEVMRYLGDSCTCDTAGELQECTDCDHRCVERCARQTREVLLAGAERISASDAVQQCEAGVAPFIDHTLLKPDAKKAEVVKLCEEARRFGFASVCVNPWYVPVAAELLRGSPVRVCTVVGFPLGATLPNVKMLEAEEAIKLGAQEIDMVMNVGALKSGLDELVEQDIRGVVSACRRGGAICKVILETSLLGLEEKVRACLAAKRAGADFVKTSTGFSSGGATVEDVSLMRAVVGSDMGVKASGGVRTFEDFQKMVKAGASRIGASASVRIIEQACPPAAAAAPPVVAPSSY